MKDLLILIKLAQEHLFFCRHLTASKAIQRHGYLGKLSALRSTGEKPFLWARIAKQIKNNNPGTLAQEVFMLRYAVSVLGESAPSVQ